MTEEQLLKPIGERIAKYRKNKKLTQAQLANLMGVSPTYVSSLECGRANFSVTVLFSLTEALDVSADELLRTNAPIVPATDSNELKALLSDCTPAESQAIIEAVKGMKAAFQSVKHKN